MMTDLTQNRSDSLQPRAAPLTVLCVECECALQSHQALVGITTCAVVHLAQRGLFPQIQSEPGQCGDFNYELWCNSLSLTWSESTSKTVHQVRV